MNNDYDQYIEDLYSHQISLDTKKITLLFLFQHRYLLTDTQIHQILNTVTRLNIIIKGIYRINYNDLKVDDFKNAKSVFINDY